MGQIKIVVKKVAPYPKYSESFRRQVVRESRPGCPRIGNRKRIKPLRQPGYCKQAYYQSLSRKRTAGLQQEQIKQKVLSVRHHLPRLGTRKLYKLLEEDFRQHGLKIGRDGLFELLRRESLLVVRKRKYVSTTDRCIDSNC